MWEPGKYWVRYEVTGQGAMSPGRYRRQVKIAEGEGWDEAQEQLWRKHHFNPLAPYQPTMTLYRKTKIEEDAALMVVSEPGAETLMLDLRYRLHMPAEMIWVTIGKVEGE